MMVSLVNDGPVTITIDVSRDIDLQHAVIHMMNPAPLNR